MDQRKTFVVDALLVVARFVAGAVAFTVFAVAGLSIILLLHMYPVIAQMVLVSLFMGVPLAAAIYQIGKVLLPGRGEWE